MSAHGRQSSDVPAEDDPELLAGVAGLRPQASAGLASGSSELLLESFEAGTLDPGGFHHRDHVRLAWLVLRRDPLPRALDRFPEALRRFAQAAGKPQLYHETVTYAYLLVIHEQMQQRPAGDTWEAFATAHPDLLSGKPSVLERYYRKETLASDLARRVFLMPDRLSSA